MRKPLLISALSLMLAALLLCGCAAPAPVFAPADTSVPVPAPTPAPAPSPLPTVAPLPFSLIWMSDTQHYSNAYLEYFAAMTEWTVENRRRLRIRYVVHTGDVVGTASKAYTWVNAESAMSTLRDADMPVFMLAGNHDSFSAKTKDFTSYLEFRKPYLAPDEEVYRDGLCSAATFTAGGADFLLVGISCNVLRKDAAAVDWVNSVLDKYPDHIAILCFHSYMDIGKRLIADGVVAMNSIIPFHKNVRLVLAGHCRGVSKKQTAFDDDGDGTPERVVDQIVMNYQSVKKGGSGYLGIMRFDPKDGSVSVTAYSPFLNDYGYYQDGRDIFVIENVF